MRAAPVPSSLWWNPGGFGSCASSNVVYEFTLWVPPVLCGNEHSHSFNTRALVSKWAVKSMACMHWLSRTRVGGNRVLRPMRKLVFLIEDEADIARLVRHHL